MINTQKTSQVGYLIITHASLLIYNVNIRIDSSYLRLHRQLLLKDTRNPSIMITVSMTSLAFEKNLRGHHGFY